jgi:hypothetical protein
MQDAQPLVQNLHPDILNKVFVLRRSPFAGFEGACQLELLVRARTRYRSSPRRIGT